MMKRSLLTRRQPTTMTLNQTQTNTSCWIKEAGVYGSSRSLSCTIKYQDLYSSNHTLQVPKFLLERWAAVNAEDVHLATIRVYTPPNGGKPRFVLFLPPNREPTNSQDSSNGSPAPGSTPPPQLPNRPAFSFSTSYATTGAEPDCYELDMVNESVENQIVVAERPKDSSLSIHGASAPYNSRARTTILTGRIKHECNLRPSFSENYRKQMRERHLKYNTKQRQIRMIEDAGVSGGRGGINRLSSGVGVGSGGAFSDLVVRILFSCHNLKSTSVSENKAETPKGFRAHGSYSTKPTPRSTLFSLPRYATLGSAAIT